MYFKVKHLLILVGFACFLQAKAEDDLKRGLYFRSFEVDKDKRTCLDLTPDKDLIFKDGFSIEFDIKIKAESFGYVFRIIGNDTLNIDFLTKPDRAGFSLVIKNKTLLQYNDSEIGGSPINSWIKVLIKLDPEKNEILFSLNNVEKTTSYPLTGLRQFNVYFGGNTHDIFSSTDVTSMVIKDIQFYNHKGKLTRYWKLEKHALDCVYDECVADKAMVVNPIWEIDNHVKWNKRKTLILPDLYYQITSNPYQNLIFFVKGKNVLVYHMTNHQLDTIRVLAGIPYNADLLNQLVYDSARNELISYDFDHKQLARFNFQSRTWNNEDNSNLTPRYGHHSKVYIAEDSLLVAFGGYGYHKYNSLLFEHSGTISEWKSYDLSSSIPPRYLGSMGYLGAGKLLYFGGYGNESGKQEEFPRNYYDLYTIDVHNHEVKKIWNIPSIKEHFTNSNSLVIGRNNSMFYALAYPNKRYASTIRLHEYQMEKPEYRTAGDSIPYFFNDAESYCDLFQNSDSSELYVVSSYIRGNNSEINIYSIASPPLNPDEIFQYPPIRSRKWFWLLAILLPIGILSVFFLYRNRKTTAITTTKTTIAQPELKKEPLQNGTEEIPVVYQTLAPEKRASSVNLLGNFRVIDKDGNDITSNFTPTTIQLFLLLLMSTIKNGRGISSQELKTILWYDKDDDSARNNRNVYINKLRSILKSFGGGIEVLSKDGYWTINLDKNVFCDFERVLLLVNTLQTNVHLNRKLMEELVDIALRGKLLSYLQQSEWVETYQTDYSNMIIESLLEFTKRDEVKTDLMMLLKIADVILLHDSIDEDAIKLKCYALFHLGRKNQALQSFNKFTAEYENLLAAKHNLSFDEMVKKSDPPAPSDQLPSFD